MREWMIAVGACLMVGLGAPACAEGDETMDQVRSADNLESPRVVLTVYSDYV